MFGDKFNLGNLTSLMKNAGKIQDMMKEAQEKLKQIEVIGESGAGAVQIIFDAQNYAKSTKIDDEVFKEGKEIVQELITAAINDGAKKIEKEKEKLVGSAGGLMGGLLDGNK